MTAPTYSLSASCIVPGVVASFAFDDATTVTLTATAAIFGSSMIGKKIVVAGSTSAGNDGTFVITKVTSTTVITYENASGVTEDGAAESATTLKVHNLRVGDPFELSLLVDSTSATYNVQVFEIGKAAPQNFAISPPNIQGSTAGAGMKQVTTGFSDPASNINVPAPVTVATGATQTFVVPVVPMSKTEVQNTYTISLQPKVKNVTSGAFEAVNTTISVIF